MLQSKDCISNKSRKTIVSDDQKCQSSALSGVQDLLRKMIDYESAACNKRVDLSSGQFKMLTASECEVVRAELVADYIRLSAGSLGSTPEYYNATLTDFCSKICDMEIPSHELLGTYLAAVSIVQEDKLTQQLPKLDVAVCRTMVSVLHACIERLDEQAKQKTQARPSNKLQALPV